MTTPSSGFRVLLLCAFALCGGCTTVAVADDARAPEGSDAATHHDDARSLEEPDAATQATVAPLADDVVDAGDPTDARPPTLTLRTSYDGPTNVTARSARVEVNATWTSGEQGESWFEYRARGSSAWSRAPWVSRAGSLYPSGTWGPMTGAGSATWNTDLAGLDELTTYEYRACVRLRNGGASTGDDCYDASGDPHPQSESDHTWPIVTTASTGLAMGFGETRAGDRNWLRLDDPAKFDRNGDGDNDRVAEYLDDAGASYVAVYVSWCRVDQLMRGVGQPDILRDLQSWVATAASQDKSVLITLGYEPPDRFQKRPSGRDSCVGAHVAMPATSASAIVNIDAVAGAIHACLHGDGMYGCSAGTNYVGNVTLEVGSETNWTGTDPTGAAGDPVVREDARFFYDVVNYVAYRNRDFPRVLFGGPMLRGGDWSGSSNMGVGGEAYVREALTAPSVNDPWDGAMPDGLRFDGFGAHISHCTAPENRSLWRSCTSGSSVYDLIDELRTTLQTTAPASSHPELRIWITALLPTETLEGSTSAGSAHGSMYYSHVTQRDDTREIWNGVRTAFAGRQWGVATIVWNHLADTGQDGFPTAGFMSCPGWTTWRSTPDPDCWPYSAKSVLGDAHTWRH